MNRQRRKMLNTVLDGLARLRDPVGKDEALQILKDAQINVEKCADEEQDALDNRPEQFQWSAANDDMNDNISDLSEAYGELDELIEKCQETQDYNYKMVEDGVITIVNLIKQTIHR